MAETLTSLSIELEELRHRLNRNPYARKLMNAFSKTIKLVPDGGDPLYIVFRDGEMLLPHAEGGDEDLRLELNGSERFTDVLQGNLDITHTLASGELAVTKGKVTDLILWNRIVVAGLKK